jgi:hypothetical protein
MPQEYPGKINMLTKFRMKTRIEKTALFAMALGLFLSIIFVFIIFPLFFTSTPRLTDSLSMGLAVLPGIVLIGITLLNRLFGALLGLILSALVLLIFFASLVSGEGTTAYFYLIAVTVCYLAGSILAFCSVRISAPAQTGNKV